MKTIILKWIQEHVSNGYYLVSGGKVFLIDYYIEYKWLGMMGIIMWLNSFGKTSFIVSKYDNYEWINTYSGFFAFPFEWECKSQGYKEYDVVKRNINDDTQVLYHSPYDI